MRQSKKLYIHVGKLEYTAKEFAINGYVLDKKRLENGSFLGEDYFERLLEDIREIRLIERRFYQKLPIIMQPVLITIKVH